jgi:tetratricopeptide (TPR) repeat protein
MEADDFMERGFELAGRAQEEEPERAAGLLQEAIDAFSAAIRAFPDHAEAWAQRGIAKQRRGWVEERRGQDPLPWYRAAIRDLSRAIRMEADFAWLLERGCARVFLSQEGRCRKPLSVLQAAVRDLGAAIERLPAELPPAIRAGVLQQRVLARLAIARMRRAEKLPWASFMDLALADLDQIVELADQPEHRALRAEALLERAEAEDSDPVPWCQRALKDLDGAAASGAALRARALALIGRAEREAGLDEAATRAAAMTHADEAVASGEAGALGLRAVLKEQAGDAPGALADAMEALRLDPGDRHARAVRLRAAVHQAGRPAGTSRQQMKAWLDSAGLRRALAEMGELVGARPRELQLRLIRAAFNEAIAQGQLLCHRDPCAAMEAALADLDAAVGLAPENVDLRLRRGELRCEYMTRRVDRGDEEGIDYAGAVADLDVVVRRRDSVRARVSRAAALMGQAVFDWLRGPELLQRAARDCEAALATEPGHPRAMVLLEATRALHKRIGRIK